MEVDIQKFDGILKTKPDGYETFDNGCSIAWNLLCHTLGEIPRRTVLEGREEWDTIYFTLDDLVFMRDSFRANIYGVNPSIYIGHEDRSSGTPAAGTILDVAVVEDEGNKYSLYIKTLWTPTAREAIETGMYKYLSIETNIVDKKHYLTGAALTNEPACKPQEQILASSVRKENKTPKAYMELKASVYALGSSQQIPNTEGNDMDDKQLDALVEVLNPEAVFRKLLATDAGKEAFAKIVQENTDMLTQQPDEGETPPPAEGDNPTPAEGDTQAAEGDNPTPAEGDKKEPTEGTAASLSTRASRLFDSEVKTVASFIKATTAQVHAKREECIATAFKTGNVGEAVRQCIASLVSIQHPTPGRNVVPAQHTNGRESSPTAQALKKQGY